MVYMNILLMLNAMLKTGTNRTGELRLYFERMHRSYLAHYFPHLQVTGTAVSSL